MEVLIKKEPSLRGCSAKTLQSCVIHDMGTEVAGAANKIVTEEVMRVYRCYSEQWSTEAQQFMELIHTSQLVQGHDARSEPFFTTRFLGAYFPQKLAPDIS